VSHRSKSPSTLTPVSLIILLLTNILPLNEYLVDGIVNVSAKDKATNKDQSMTIASSSGLSDKDIEKMVAEAEQYAETDKARRSLIEEANKADSVCSDIEKSEMILVTLSNMSTQLILADMNDFKDQVDATEKENVNKLVGELRAIAVKGQAGDSSVTADAIREKINETQKASLGLFQKVWPFTSLHLYSVT